MQKAAFRVPGNPKPWPDEVVAAYHITHVDNLKSIVDEASLKCNNRCSAENLGHRNIGHGHIKRRRDETKVEVAKGGTIGDYVPFYFAPRSPMLYSINGGYVDGYDGDQKPILHLVTAVPQLATPGEFVITDGHAAMELSQQHGELDGLREVDWNIMHAKYWRDTDEDGDRRRRRQAEFLVHGEVPFERVRLIGAFDDETAAIAREVIAGSGFDTEVVIRRDWYY